MLTEKIVRDAKPSARQVKISDRGHPIILVVNPSGAKSFVGRLRVNGSQTTRKLGDWPAMSLVAARTAIAELIEEQDATKHTTHEYERVAINPLLRPVAKKDDAKITAYSSTNDVWDAYIEATKGKVKESTNTARKNDWRTYFRDGIGKTQLRNLTRKAIKDVFEEVTEKGKRGEPAPIAANTALAYMSAFLTWCVVRKELIEVNPALGIIKNPTNPRELVLSQNELSVILATQDAAGAAKDALMLTLLTLCRPSEIMNLCWSDIDFDAKTIFIRDPKNGNDHIVHLTEKMRSHLPERGEKKHFDKVFDLGKDSYKKLHRKWRVKSHELAAEKDIRLTQDWQIRDFRGTAATWVSSLMRDDDLQMFPAEIVERLLNHVESKVTRKHYDMNKFLPQRRKALEMWSDHVSTL